MYCVKYHFLLALNLPLAVTISPPLGPVQKRQWTLFPVQISMPPVILYFSTISSRILENGSSVEYSVKIKQANWRKGGRTLQLLILSECFIHRSPLACSYSSWKRSCIHFSHHTLLIFCNYVQTLNYICIIKFSTTADILALSSGSNSLREEKANRIRKKRGDCRKKGILCVGDQTEKSYCRVNHIILCQKSICYLYIKGCLQAYIS